MNLRSVLSWRRFVPLLLLLLLLMFQYQLWFGVGNVPAAMRLRGQVEAQTAENAGLAKRNQALAAEVTDLKQGTAAVEERARTVVDQHMSGRHFREALKPESYRILAGRTAGDRRQQIETGAGTGVVRGVVRIKDDANAADARMCR